MASTFLLGDAMIQKVITYEDYNGEKVTETLWFHLSEAELAELDMVFPNGFGEHTKQILAEKNGKLIIELFKMLLSISIGRRSADGRRFEKSEEIKNDFLQTMAYSALFMDLVTNANTAAEFVLGIMPSSIRGKIKPEELLTPLPEPQAPVQEKKTELDGMPQTDFDALCARLPLTEQEKALLADARRRSLPE